MERASPPFPIAHVRGSSPTAPPPPAALTLALHVRAASIGPRTSRYLPRSSTIYKSLSPTTPPPFVSPCPTRLAFSLLFGVLPCPAPLNFNRFLLILLLLPSPLLSLIALYCDVLSAPHDCVCFSSPFLAAVDRSVVRGQGRARMTLGSSGIYLSQAPRVAGAAAGQRAGAGADGQRCAEVSCKEGVLHQRYMSCW